MEASVLPSTDYREHTILFNPSGEPGAALTDAFMILEPSANPMFSAVLYAHPSDKIQSYGSEQAAYDAVMTQARAWIDAHLDGARHRAG